MPKQPLISVILPTYNTGQTLVRALGSVVSQTYSNIELVLADGGSQDNTLEIIKAYPREKFIWVSEPDSGLYDAMNKGVRLASGDWVYFLGADDELVNCLDRVASFLCDPKAIYYGDVYLPHKNKTYAGQFRWHTLVSKNINHQSIFYPRQVFERYSYNLKYPILADYDLNIRCWGEGRFKFQYMPVLVAIHQDGGLSHRKMDDAFERDKPVLIKKYFGRKIALRSAWLSLHTKLGRLLRRDK